MASLEIGADGKDTRTVDLAEPVTTIGRNAASSIVLTSPFVSEKHARIKKTQEQYELEDLLSSNGTYVNGERVNNEILLQNGDTIKIGNFELKFHANGKETRTAAKKTSTAFSSTSLGASFEGKDYVNLKHKARALLISRINLKKLSAQATSDEALRQMTMERLEDIMAELASEIPPAVDRERFKKEIIDDTLGLGPIEDLLADEAISEIMVNNWDQIYFERTGKLHKSDKKFIDDAHVMAVIQRIVAPVGRAINESSPLVDARLKDGSRVNAIIPPLALQGPTLTIRKFSRRRLTTDDLIQYGSLNQNMVEFLSLAVRERKNIVISGGTGSGKTTLLNILSNFIQADQRIVTVEDAAELRLNQEHVISLEARPANMEGSGAITIRDLVKNCLRMRPDRIVVGECRGGEALDMLQAMNTGHDGSLTTAHANSPRDALSRLETMVLMSGMDLPVRAIREQITSAVDLIVQQSRLADGSRKITHITEVTGIEGDKILMQDIFTFEQQGFSKAGKVIGEFKASGIVPSFVEDLKKRGINVDFSIFSNDRSS